MLFVALLCATGLSARAAGTYPDRPIKIIVPFTAGGTSDVLARTVGEQMAKDLGQPVVVENRGGAGGALGASMVARSDPDGYTLLMGSSSALAVNPNLFDNLPYDAQKSFVPISMIAGIQNVLLVNPALPVKNVQELIAYGKQRPLFYASAGTGSSPHMSAELFQAQSGLKMTHVPFKGGPQGLSEVVAGRVDLVFENMPSAAVMVKSGQLRGLGVTAGHPSPMVPDIPTIASQGMVGYDVTVWYGLVAPAGTPAEIVKKLGDEVASILARPEVKARLTELGTEPASSTSQAFGTFIAGERQKWGEVIKKAGIKVDG
ncbi:Bug family tripartite tricarboxylate transporter substrate binding protein [Bordetella genomosp. 13]|uniref:Bug family tripartite tricarboxylate transporter substrate binding protein n=1 Tax=Bordetella genomosp. 13 TaxID=463040 RepID=UPI0016435794|nr:tripartite tricarboxylate transporter substrate binding protein [Bordetella genomosp. 13]